MRRVGVLDFHAPDGMGFAVMRRVAVLNFRLGFRRGRRIGTRSLPESGCLGFLRAHRNGLRVHRKSRCHEFPQQQNAQLNLATTGCLRPPWPTEWVSQSCEEWVSWISTQSCEEWVSWISTWPKDCVSQSCGEWVSWISQTCGEWVSWISALARFLGRGASAGRGAGLTGAPVVPPSGGLFGGGISGRPSTHAGSPMVIASPRLRLSTSMIAPPFRVTQCRLKNTIQQSNPAWPRSILPEPCPWV